MTDDDPETMYPPSAECTVYRAYDALGELLYVGITGTGEQRFHQHRVNSDWCPRCNTQHPRGKCCHCGIGAAAKSRNGIRRCWSCDNWLRRHGHERPPDAIAEATRRELHG